MSLPDALNLARADQIGIVVHDLDSAVGVYEDKLGWGPFEVHESHPDSKPYFRFRSEPGQYSIRLAVNRSAPQIELIQPVSGPSPYLEHLTERGQGIQHLGFYVPEIEPISRAMADAGFEVLAEASGYGADKRGAFACYDTTDVLGYSIEVIRKST